MYQQVDGEPLLLSGSGGSHDGLGGGGHDHEDIGSLVDELLFQ